MHWLPASPKLALTLHDLGTGFATHMLASLQSPVQALQGDIEGHAAARRAAAQQAAGLVIALRHMQRDQRICTTSTASASAGAVARALLQQQLGPSTRPL